LYNIDVNKKTTVVYFNFRQNQYLKFCGRKIMQPLIKY